MNNRVHVKTGDTVIVLSGKGRGKQEKVLAVSLKEGKVIVEGRNMITKHIKSRETSAPGGLVKAEGALYACKVQIVCPRCGKPTRVAYRLYEDGTKDRVCIRCGESLQGRKNTTRPD